jgi:tetratricopeptide (TPR) repeat protein
MAAPPSGAEIDARWDYARPDASEQRFTALLDDVGAGTESGGEVLTQIARCQGLQGRFEEAHRTLDRVEPLLGPHASRARARYLLERGRVLNSSGRPSEALPLFAHALGVALAAEEDFYAIDAAHMLAIASTGDDQLAWNRRGLAMVDRSRDPRVRRWRGSLCNNLGWAYHERQEYDAALQCFQDALRARESQGDEEPIRIARWCVARGLRSVGRVEDALAIQRALLDEQRSLGLDAGETYEEIVACLEALGHDAEAQTVRREWGSAAAEAAGSSPPR